LFLLGKIFPCHADQEPHAKEPPRGLDVTNKVFDCASAILTFFQAYHMQWEVPVPVSNEFD
jgi:hypothetical protein